LKSLTIWILQTGEPLQTDGGNHRPMRAMNLSNALVAAGHKVVVWSSAFYHQEKRHRAILSEPVRISEKLEIRLIPSCGYRRNIGIGRLIDHAQLAFNLKKMLKRTAQLPDAAFIGFPPIETAAVMARWLLNSEVPFMLDIKDQWPLLFLDPVPSFLRPLGRAFLTPYFFLAKRAMNDATCLSAMANSFIDWSAEFSRRERTDMDAVFPLTSPSGQVSEPELEEARKWWDAQGVMHDNRFRVCFVGSHSPAFNFEPVREAACIMAQRAIQCDFIICGHGDTSFKLRKMMAGLPNVRFPGWIDRPKIEVLAGRCHAAIAPYVNTENFTKNIPNKIIDALAMGLPIFCPLKGEVASLITQYKVGMLYESNGERTLYKCLKILMQNAGMKKSMSQCARSLYDRQFSFDTVYGGLVQHLEKLASLK
jgi:glycosyltransferase involved in cell wall biosynthesis